VAAGRSLMPPFLAVIGRVFALWVDRKSKGAAALFTANLLCGPTVFAAVALRRYTALIF